MNTVVQDAIAQYGVNNIFMVASSYRSMYHDDYCSFTYYNNVTGEFFSDEWATAYAAPAYGNFECMPIAKAFENNLVDKVKLFEVLKERKLNWINNFTFNFYYKFDELANLHLRVNVSKGRKWKGTGFLVGTFVRSYQWGVKMWHSNNDYGTSHTRYAKIYDPSTNRIETVVSNNVEFVDAEALISKYKEDMINIINNSTSEDIHNRLEIECGTITFEQWLESHKNTIDTSTAFDEVENAKKIKEQEQEAKKQAFKEKKMIELIEWVKTNTDKHGDEIQKLAEHIFNKRYN